MHIRCLWTDCDGTLTRESLGRHIVDEARRERPEAVDARVRLYQRWNGRMLRRALDGPGGLSAFLEAHRAVETVVFQELSATRLFAGVRRDRLRELERDGASVRDGACAVLAAVLAAGGQAHVVSAGWSADLIRPWAPEGVQLHCNEMRFDDAGVATGELVARVTHGFAKTEILRETDPGGDGLSVYVGDAVDDILALRMADVGIVIQPSAMLVEAMARFGIDATTFHEGMSAERGTIYRVDSWADIHKLLQL